MARGNKRKEGGMSTSNNSGAKPLVQRNRASPSRIVKLYRFMSEQQKNMIRKAGSGGLLQIACATIPGELATWLVVDCFDAEACKLVFPGRGKIAVTAESVFTIMGLPTGGDDVKYELDADAINSIHVKYGMSAPKINTVIKRIKDNKAANDDFLRSWLMLAVSTFLCPSTSLDISPRCYPPLLDLSCVSKLNWSQFVVDQIKNAALKMDCRNSVKGCLFFLVILYVDSLNVENVPIPNTKPRIGAWNKKLLDKVIKLDTNRDGSFGKLRLKESGHSVAQNSLVQMDDVQKFVSYKVPAGMSVQKKRKLCEAINKVCGSITELLGAFVKEVSEIEDPPERCLRRSKRNTPAEEDEDENEFLEASREEDSDYEHDGTDESGDDDSEYLELEDEDGDTEESGDEDWQPTESEASGHSTENANSNGANNDMDTYGDVPGRQEDVPVPCRQDDEDEDFVPLIRRLRMIQSAGSQVDKVQTAEGISSNEVEPSIKSLGNKDSKFQAAPGAVAPYEQAKKLGDAESRRAKLRLPDIQTKVMPRGDADKNNTSEGECCNTKLRVSTDDDQLLDFLLSNDFQQFEEEEPTTISSLRSQECAPHLRSW